MRFKKGLIMLLAVIVLISSLATAEAGYSIKQQWARFSATCGETITTGQMVAIKDADGYAYKADADASTLRPAVGIAGSSCTSGGKVAVIVMGIVRGWTSLAEGAPAYLSETAGAVTQSAPAWAQQIGNAISTTEYLINCQNYMDVTDLPTLGIAGYALDTDNVTLASTDCGEVHALATDAKVYTLPATIENCIFTFINAGAAGNNIIAVDPNASDQIFGSCDAVVIAGAAGEKLQNTKATAKRGDSVTLVGDGADGWYIIGCTGVWAEETP